MNKLLPLPTLDYFPAALRNSESIQALATQLDTEFSQWFADAKNLETLKDPARCPAICLDAFGAMFSAGFRNEDTEAIKRKKISTALKNLKLRGTWIYSVKIAIDGRIGGNSSIVSQIGLDDFILCGTGTEPAGYLWSILGGVDPESEYGISLVSGAGIIETIVDNIFFGDDQAVFVGTSDDGDSFVFGGIDDTENYGVRMLGDGTEITTSTSPYVDFRIKGIIAIDIGSSICSDAQILSLVRDLQDLVPCYFRIYLGYMSGNQFVAYPLGIIGG